MRPILELVEIAQNDDTEPLLVRAALRDLLQRDASFGVATALEILAREPRFRPSRGLLIDPANAARRHWGQRVAACAALLESSALPRVREEVEAEMAECADFAADVRLAVGAPVRRTVSARRPVRAGARG
jgi:hypothetical protein